MIPVYSLRKGKLVPIACFEDLPVVPTENKPIDATTTEKVPESMCPPAAVVSGQTEEPGATKETSNDKQGHSCPNC